MITHILLKYIKFKYNSIFGKFCSNIVIRLFVLIWLYCMNSQTSYNSHILSIIEIYNCLNNKLLFWLIVAICITFSFSSRWRRILYFVVGEYVSCIFGLYYSSRLMSSSFKERCYRFHCHFGIWKWYKPSVKTNYYISVVMIFTQIIMRSYITIIVKRV